MYARLPEQVMWNTAHMAECLQEAHHFGFYRNGPLASDATHVRHLGLSELTVF